MAPGQHPSRTPVVAASTLQWSNSSVRIQHLRHEVIPKKATVSKALRKSARQAAEGATNVYILQRLYIVIYYIIYITIISVDWNWKRERETLYKLVLADIVHQMVFGRCPLVGFKLKCFCLSHLLFW